MLYPAYMPGLSHIGGPHTVCGTRRCVRDPVYMPGTTYNFQNEMRVASPVTLRIPKIKVF